MNATATDRQTQTQAYVEANGFKNLTIKLSPPAIFSTGQLNLFLEILEKI